MSAHQLLGSQLRLVAAPMAGGPTTPALATAVADAGAFPFLAGGYKAPEAIAAEVEHMRSAGRPFGVNLFVPGEQAADAAALAAYAARLEPEAAAHGVALDPRPVVDDDAWEEKLALLLADPVPVVSLTFGLPSQGDVAALQQRGSVVLATVTSADEARAAAAVGVDGVIAQGAAAGGHSGTHDPTRMPVAIGTEALLRSVLAAIDLPVIAAGGVDGPTAVRSLLATGAEAVAVGTMLLRTDEAGTSATHRSALGDPAFTETVVTRAFTGRPARALRNGFIDRHGDAAPAAYPAVHHLTRRLRSAAGAAGDTERLHLWAGTGYRSAPTGPAADVVRWLTEG